MATATAPAAVSSPSRLRLKYLFWSCFALILGYVLVHNESFLVNRSNPIWQHYEPFKWWLLPHGLAGACAILLGPMQFSDRLRQRYAKLHRVVGRIYVFGAVVAAPMGAYIQYFNERIGASRSFTIAATVDALLLMSTTAIAFYFIRQRKIQQHRAWMTRSFACALIFLEVRLTCGLFGLDGNLPATEIVVRTYVGLALLLSDIALQIQESLRARPVAVKASLSTSRLEPSVRS